jgi:hypothetical protein
LHARLNARLQAQLDRTTSGGVSTRCADAPSPRLLHAIEQFNYREYFECHETLEGIWNDEPGPVRVLYKGILQIGVGCYHLLRGNYRGAILKLRTGTDYLEAFAPDCMTIQVAQLIADAHQLRSAIIALGPDRLREVDLLLLPRIQVGGPPPKP